VDYGIGVSTALECVASPSGVLEFKLSAKKALIVLATRLLKNSPLRISFLCDLSCLSPHFCVQDPAVSAKKFERVLIQMVRDSWLDKEESDAALSQFRCTSHLFATVPFDASCERLDNYYHQLLLDNPEFRSLCKVTKMLLTLSHGQATVERGFSVNKAMLREGLSSQSIIALCQVRLLKCWSHKLGQDLALLIFIYLLFNLTQVQDAVAVSGGELVVPITDEMIRRYRQSRSAYQCGSEAQKSMIAVGNL
jgi:hypothetical protein